MKPANQAGVAPASAVAVAIAPLIVWIIVQLTALLLAAGRVPLSARFPQPAERWALHEMLVVQIVVAGMLFSWLMRSRNVAIAIIVTSWPFVTLAGVLADATAGQMIVAAGYVTGWLIALAMLASSFRVSPRAQLVAIALVNVLTLGVPILLYLQAESGRVSSTLSAAPVTAALKLLTASAPLAWIALAIYVGISGVAWAITRRK